MASDLKSIPAVAPGAGGAALPEAIDASCRLPLFALFLGAGAWLLVGSAFALIASIKFHSPDFLAGSAWLTYGRVRPASSLSLLYGFLLQAGLGVGLWLLARLGRTVVTQGWLVAAGAALLNLGVALGLVGVLRGDSTGFEMFELPAYASPLVFIGYSLVGLWSLLTFHRRYERRLFVSSWFVVAALFWFPWIYSTAGLLLVAFPVRGVTQAVIAWWFANNLQYVWAWLLGLGILFYFLPRLAGRELHSRPLALFVFWLVVLCGSWGGIPWRAPVPAWMPALSNAMNVVTLVPIVAVALVAYGTLRGPGAGDSTPPEPSLPFLVAGTGSFLVAGLARALASLPAPGRILELTWFGPARDQLNGYGFFAMVLFAAVYYILPRAAGQALPAPKLVRIHFGLALGGILLTALPLGVGGVLQGLRLQEASLPFAAIEKGMLPFLRISTVGDLLMGLGHLCFFCNLVGLAVRFYRGQIVASYAAATVNLTAAGVKL